MTTEYKFSGDLANSIGADAKKVTVRIDHNAVDADGRRMPLVDLDANRVLMYGPAQVALQGLTFEVMLIASDSTGTNVDDGLLRWTMTVSYADANNTMQTWTLRNFEITGDLDLSDAVGTADPPAVVANQYLTQMQALIDEAGEITGLTGEDEAVALLVGNSGSDTFAALDATNAGLIEDAGSETAAALSASIAEHEAAPKLHFLDSYDNFDIDPAWWTDDRHLNATGYAAFANFIANAQSGGEYIIGGTTPKVTFLGNSWIASGGTAWATAVQARIPGAAVVNAGFAGDESDLLLARFDTDVPADSDYVVINEPGVNDTASLYSPATQAANLEALWRKTRAIGATLIYTGHIPLAFAPAATYAAAMRALLADGAAFPAVTPEAMAETYKGAGMVSAPNDTSVGVGPGALAATPTGAGNTGIGYNAGFALAAGTYNFALGYAALSAAVSGNFNVAIGGLALRYATSNYNVGIGHSALQSVTSGTGNIAIGYLAGYNVAGSTADATTDKHSQTIIGRQAGGNASNIVAIGYYAAAKAEGAVAIGGNTVAAYSGSVAIGRDNTAAGAATAASNEIALGTALHTTRLRGWLQLDKGQTTVGAAGAAAALPATPTKYLSVKDSAGTEYVLPVYAKA